MILTAPRIGSIERLRGTSPRKCDLNPEMLEEEAVLSRKVAMARLGKLVLSEGVIAPHRFKSLCALS